MISKTKIQSPSWPTRLEVMTTSFCRVGGYISTPSPTVQVQTTPVRRAVQRDSAILGY